MLNDKLQQQCVSAECEFMTLPFIHVQIQTLWHLNTLYYNAHYIIKV